MRVKKKEILSLPWNNAWKEVKSKGKYNQYYRMVASFNYAGAGTYSQLLNPGVNFKLKPQQNYFLTKAFCSALYYARAGVTRTVDGAFLNISNAQLLPPDSTSDQGAFAGTLAFWKGDVERSCNIAVKENLSIQAGLILDAQFAAGDTLGAEFLVEFEYRA